jgi:4-hydroxy-tetrahydrodipicolinate reductase
MKIALIGYGRMGKEIERIANSRGHTIDLIVDKDNYNDLNSSKLKSIDVAIEFTIPEQALANIKKCLQENVPVVSGTTGWLKHFDEAVTATLKSSSAFLYASNFSIGVNILFHLNERLSELMRGRSEYSPTISEIHHIKKLDSPSGTAIKLANDIINKDDDYKQWLECDSLESFKNSDTSATIPIKSIREGEVPGTHEIEWNSSVDSISLRHKAHGRQGLALGAVLAAEFIIGKSGFLTMRDMLGF